jgi:FkbM family methyltransferase
LFFNKYLPSLGDVIVDIGSGVGAEISMMSRMVGDGGVVYAIEADPSLYRKNLKVVELLGLSNVVCLNVAITDFDGYVNLNIFSEDGNDSTIYGSGENSVRVESRSIDSLFLEHGISSVDYIKINIEGAEKQALMGCINSFASIKNWCVSCHDFIGFKTKNFVVNFFNNKGKFVEIHDEVEGEPWKGGYFYA